MFKKITYCFFVVLLLCIGLVIGVNAQNNDVIEKYDPNKEYEIGDVVYFDVENGIGLFSTATATYKGDCARDWKNTAGRDTIFWTSPYQNSYITIWNLGQTFSTDQMWYVDYGSFGQTFYRTTTAWVDGYGYVVESANQTITSINHTYSYAKHYGSYHRYYCDCGSYYYNYYDSYCYDCYPGTLKYYANGGSGAPSSSTVYESYPTISSTKPTRFGYKFLGWSTSSSATSASYEPGDNIYVGTGSTKKLYAVWEASKTLETDSQTTSSTYIDVKGTIGYFKFTPTVSATYVFESTNSSGDPRAYLYNSDGTQLSSNNDSGEGTNTSNFKISYELTAGTTYYYGVKWYSSSTTGTINVKLRRQYNITFDANGGSEAPATQTKLCGDTLTLSTTTPAKTGYTFLGWASESKAVEAEFTAGGELKANTDMTLYAIWKAEGKCGDSISWVLDNSGTLTLSGAGDMQDFSSTAETPWNTYSNDINKVIISNGISSVGANAFKLCSNLTEISLATSIDKIGETAFAYSPITSIVIPEGTVQLGASAFEGCDKLTTITLPETLNEIGESAFINCKSLDNVILPNGISEINKYVFAECSGLKTITIPKTVKTIDDYSLCFTNIETVNYGGSKSLWNKISVGSENDVLSNAVICYALEDFTVTYAVTTNGAASADKISEQVPNGEKADLSVVAQRASLPGSGPIGTEKDVPWEFLGWNTDQNATEALGEVVVTSDVTLYPIFKKELTFNFYHANNELLESKTVTIYNADIYATFVVPKFDTYLDWEPIEWCNNQYYDEVGNDARMYEMGTEANFRFSADLYARYQRTTTVSYEVGDYSGSFEPYTFTQYYYGSGQKTSVITVLPEVLTWTGEPQFYGWAEDSIDGNVFKYPDRFTVSKDTTMYALWQERTSVPTITVSNDSGLQIVSMSCSMDGAEIYYTIDGTRPTLDSDLYTDSIIITGNEDITFKAMAVKEDYAYSKVTTKTVVLNAASTPISSVLPGYIEKNSIVCLSTETPNATIYYTTDGSVPTLESEIYSSPLTVAESTEIYAFAVKDGMKDSAVTLFKYTVIDSSVPYINITTNINEDKTLTVTVKITDNSKSAGGSFNLIYDNSVLEIVNVIKGNYIKYANPYIKKDYNDNTIRVVWAGAEELDGGGEILTATFNLLSTDKEQTLLSIEKAKLSDADANKLNVQSSDAIVLLSNNTQYFNEYKTETTVGADKKSLVVNLVERAEENGCIITAVYNNDGRLIQWKPTTIIEEQDSYTVTFDKSLEKGQKVKVFIWNSLSNLKPVSGVAEFIYE